MKYISMFSGIEAATVAWHPLGWEPIAFAETAPFPSAVLAHRFPDVPNLGDITEVDWSAYRGAADVLVGGSPCQSFSVAGLRKGLADPRGNLALEYLRAVDGVRPTWVVWENVPGVLSADGGRAFGTFLGGLGQLGYGFAYRVLDAQYVRVESHPRAVPQRRRRVFVVGYLGDWRRAAAVLLEREALAEHRPPGRSKQHPPSVVSFQPAAYSRGFGQRPDDSGVVGTLQTFGTETKQAVMFIDGPSRYLTPLECERLQGFPDGWTDVLYRGKPAADGPRYKAIGSSMAVNVMRFIGERTKVVTAVVKG